MFIQSTFGNGQFTNGQPSPGTRAWLTLLPYFRLSWNVRGAG
jgi:hypothetical protein